MQGIDEVDTFALMAGDENDEPPSRSLRTVFVSEIAFGLM